MNFTPNPIAFSFFGLDIHWYSIMVCSGILLGCAIAYTRCPSRGIKRDDFLDVLLISVPAGICGARLWYVFFNRAYYHSLYEVLNIRAGGLAIHGGLVFGLLTGYLICRHKKLPCLRALDLAVPCVALAQAIGRWGNYFNSEAHGGPTDLPWGIPVDGVYVHPTFLYESLWCLMLFFVLSAVDKRKRFDGQVLCLYAMLYSLERFFVEQLRTDSLLIGPKKLITALQAADCNPAGIEGVLHIGDFLIIPAKTAQLISLAAIIIGAICYRILSRRKKTIPAIESDDAAPADNVNNNLVSNTKDNPDRSKEDNGGAY